MPKTIRQQYVPYINIYLRFSCCNCSSLADIVLAFEISQLHQITHTHTHTHFCHDVCIPRWNVYFSIILYSIPSFSKLATEGKKFRNQHKNYFCLSPDIYTCQRHDLSDALSNRFITVLIHGIVAYVNSMQRKCYRE